MPELARHLPRRAGSKLRADLIETSRSISANIAEGFGRGPTAEKIHYSRMANGSLEESHLFLDPFSLDPSALDLSSYICPFVAVGT